jgi:hypothetical protein
MNEPIINLRDYTVAEHVTFAIGCLLWVFTYVVVIKNIRRYQFVEIPFIAVSANFAWEFLWSWVFRTDMGLLYVWGYRVWFFLDCVIVWHTFRLAWKQLPEGLPRAMAIWAFSGGIAAWFGMLYFYIKNYDLPISHMGAYSGYILNVLMSALYIPLLLRIRNLEWMSEANAWFKGVGTALITVFCFMHFKEGFLLSMCVVTTALDATYLYLLYSIKSQGRTT